MKKWIAFVGFASLLPAQALVEHAAAATGGTVGGVAGKKVSDGLSKIFEKVDGTTKKAAKAGESGKSKEVDAKGVPLLQVGPGSPTKGRDTSGVVPPPPPARRAGVQTQAPAPAPAPVVVAPPPPTPPLPEVKVEDLKKLIAGTKREEVLKLGPPASRVTMFDDGHLLEIYRYMAGDTTLGVVRLVDGSVTSLLIR